MTLDRIRIGPMAPLGLPIEIRWIGFKDGPWVTWHVETIGL